jgi:phosphodiesterase/alkaline phosphatase D-like protein
MNKLLVKLAITAAASGLLCSSPILAQNPPPQKKAEHVEIIKGPGLEVSHDDIAIIRWTSTNPGGDDDHWAVAHYGTDPNDLSQTAKNHIRLNRGHAETIFRVRLQPLKPDTTYYYKVTSMGTDERSDGVESSVNHFTTAAPGQQTSAHPPAE